MITTSKNPGHQYFRKVMVLPLVAIVLTVFAFKYKSVNSSPGRLAKIEHPITVVINAGHGGEDNGVAVNGIKEKDLTLAIAQKIERLNTDKNLKLLFTRTTDRLPTEQITAFIQNNNAQLLISVHVNADLSPKQNKDREGFKVYISPKQEKNYGNRLLSASLITELKNTYNVNRNILKPAVPWNLGSVECPAAIVECGYLTNSDDFNFITNEKNQETVARNILDAITNYAAQKSLREQDTRSKASNESPGIADTLPSLKQGVPTTRKTDATIQPSGHRAPPQTTLNDYLVIIDGVEKGTYRDIKSSATTDHAMIDSVAILKPETAIAKYGNKGRNGVFEAFTNVRKNKIVLSPINKLTIDKAIYDNIVFVEVDINASFPGGDAGFRKYVQQHVRYTTEAKNSKAGGEVRVRFIVDKNGNPRDIRTLNDPGYGFAEEAARLVKNSGKWSPGVAYGKAVNAYCTVTIHFKYFDPPVLLPVNNK